MTQVLCIFDDYSQVGCSDLYDHLSYNFNCGLVSLTEMNDPTEHVDRIKPEVIFTTSPIAASVFAGKYQTLLYLINNHPFFERTQNSMLSRKISTTLPLLIGLFANSPYIAREFNKAFRSKCKVQYPMASVKGTIKPRNVQYTGGFPYSLELQSHLPSESFQLITNPDELHDAKVLLYHTDRDDLSINWFAKAAVHGVPVITIDKPNSREISSPADCLIPLDASTDRWLYHLKLILRDRIIVSEKASNFGKRYVHMSELVNKIKQAIKEMRPVRGEQSSFAELQKIANEKSNNMPLPKLYSRKVEKSNAKRPSMLINMRQEHASILNYLNQHSHIYVGVGGIGDSLLTLAGCHSDENAHVVYACNGGVDEVVKELFHMFNIPCLIIRNLNGTMEGLQIYQQITRHNHFKSSFHIPERLNYFEWKSNTPKYLKRIVNRMPLIDILGKIDNPRHTKGVLGIAPRGSDNNNMGRQRFLTHKEYTTIVSKWISAGYTVLSFGSETDYSHYGPFPDNNAIWFSSKFARSYPLPSYPINLKHMLRALNCCDLIISVDSWVKTYAGLAGIPAKVILTRCHGKADLSLSDPSDSIFLNQEIWDFELCEISKVLAQVPNLVP